MSRHLLKRAVISGRSKRVICLRIGAVMRSNPGDFFVFILRMIFLTSSSLKGRSF